MSDTVEQIKSRLDIVDIVSGYLKIQKAGANYKARCPFHNEKTPSFYISPERQSWHCFGCNKGGDMFSFVSEIEGVEFVESMRILAAKAGVALPEYRPAEEGVKDERQKLLAIAELATKFFQKQLRHSNNGARALAYLHERGLTDTTVDTWRLGWAPNDWRALSGFLREQGYLPSDIVAAGIAVEKKAGSIYDRFRSRIMFPIADANGQVVGFTGRVFGAEVAVDGEAPAKYVNTPQTTIYDKSRILYGLDRARLDMRKRDACLLVEGNMDAIMSSQAGATNVVATSGTALTPQQLRMLGRYSTNLDFCFDADQAGQTATRRGIALALNQNFAVRVVSIADAACKDPADYVKAYGAKWTEVVSVAKPVMQYYFDQAAETFDPASAQSKLAVMKTVGPFIKRLVSRVEQGHWISRLAALLRTDNASIQADLVSLRDDLAAYDRELDEPETVSAPVSTEPIDPLSQELLAVVVRDKALLPQAAELAGLTDQRVAEVLREPRLLDADVESKHKHLVDMAVIRANEWYADFGPAELAAQLAAIGARLCERDIKTKRARLEPEIRQAELARDGDKVRSLVEEFQRYTAEIRRLQDLQSPT